MQTVKFFVSFVLCGCIVLMSGCQDELKDCKTQNRMQQEHINQLESQVQTMRLQLDQLQRQLDAAEGRSGIETSTLKEKIAALEEDIRKKESLIASMQKQLLHGASLPPELNTMLEDFAKKEDMVDYDASRGIVKFKSDLLFEKGSDKVESKAAEAVKALCGILNSEQGKEFDVIIAGHTDDMPILKPSTLAMHPTNWHLSAHRAISVLNVMTQNGIVPERLSIRGFSEYRPVAPNKPNKEGNPQNRRVEIYIVAKGM